MDRGGREERAVGRYINERLGGSRSTVGADGVNKGCVCVCTFFIWERGDGVGSIVLFCKGRKEV